MGGILTRFGKRARVCVCLCVCLCVCVCECWLQCDADDDEGIMRRKYAYLLSIVFRNRFSQSLSSTSAPVNIAFDENEIRLCVDTQNVVVSACVCVDERLCLSE